MLENLTLPSTGSNDRAAARNGVRYLPNEPRRIGPPGPQDTGPHARLEELLRSNQTFRSRVIELEAVNDDLRRELQSQARRLQVTMRELALAAERVGDEPLARVIRAAASGPVDLACAGACAAHAGPNCALHGEQACARRGAIAPVQRLSTREREVLRLLTEGSRSPCIAAHLGISIATVEVHRRNIMRKLGLHTVVALTKYAVREGLTSL